MDPRDHGYNPEQDAVACEMEPGDILVWHQNALHYSGPNRSDQQLHRLGRDVHCQTRCALDAGRSDPKNQYLDYLPVCENGSILFDLPKEFLIDDRPGTGDGELEKSDSCFLNRYDAISDFFVSLFKGIIYNSAYGIKEGETAVKWTLQVVLFVLAVLGSYSSATACSDLNGDGVVNVADFLIFVEEFWTESDL